MSLWAIVPVKPLRRGKSRLAGVLSEDERTQLNHSMFEHTIKILGEVPEISQTLVVSRDSAALAFARDLGARTVQEDGAPLLNSALRRATMVAKAYAVQGVLILPADIPQLNVQDLHTIIKLAEQPPVVVIVPDRRHDGTNALLVSPAGMIEYTYGPGSFERHCERSRKAGIRLEICELPAIALDIDYPEDLELLHSLETKQALEGL
jgi:2-phospho-L-lactate guanylyltransferase